MSTITTKDGTRIFYKDWGSGQPVVFSHGWPLNADAWDEQLHLFATNGFRAIAHDRRGHGRSDQTWFGNDMNTYADDLAALVWQLDVTDAIHVGHSTGGGEVARYIGRHGTSRVAKVVLVDAIVPGLLKTAKNPDGIPVEEFDKIRAGIKADRSQFWKDLSVLFYSANRTGSTVSQGVHDAFWRMCMQASFPAAYECVKAFSESEFIDDVANFDIPTLLIHGDDDQIVPIGVSALRSAKLIKGARLEIYEGAPHGLMCTHRERFHADLLEFARHGGDIAEPATRVRRRQRTGETAAHGSDVRPFS